MQGRNLKGIQEPDCSRHSPQKYGERDSYSQIRGECDCKPFFLKGVSWCESKQNQHFF